LRALRANRIFGTDEKHIRTKNAVMNKAKMAHGVYPRSSIVRGYAFHPCTIDDPRGRVLVRATFQACKSEAEG
jgi:hypothetical protein